METISVTKDTLGIEAVEILRESIHNLLQKKDVVTLGIPGGRSVLPIWEQVKADETIPWHRVHFFVVDERLVAADDPENNFYQAKQAFLESMFIENMISSENLHPFTYDSSLDDAGSSVYTSELASHGGKLDIIILGVGEDGHVASLFPNHEGLDNDTLGYIKIVESPKPPSERISASKSLLMTADTAIVLFLGEGKRLAYASFQDSAVPLEKCPAKLVNSINNTFVLTDLT